MTSNQYYSILLTIGGLYLIYMQRTKEAWLSLLVGVNAGLEHYDSLQHQDNGVCDGTILCTRENARHKANCLGKI